MAGFVGVCGGFVGVCGGFCRCVWRVSGELVAEEEGRIAKMEARQLLQRSLDIRTTTLGQSVGISVSQ